MIEALIASIFKNKSIADAPIELQNYFVDQLWSAVTKGYGSNLGEVDFDSPDEEMLKALKDDVARFTSAKNEVMNWAMYQELIDADGKLRSESQFFKAAYGIADEHVHSWLKAERNLAIVSAQAASKWVHITQNREDLPLLEFDAILDGHTTEICKAFNGIILPIDHPFWDEYYIPNHYGERSTIRQLDSGEETDVSTIVYPEKIPAIFKVNLAKKKMIFPPDHPYYGK